MRAEIIIEPETSVQSHPHDAGSADLPPTIYDLFKTYCSLDDYDARREWAFANPRLLSIETVRALDQSVGDGIEGEKLGELEGIRVFAATHPENYPVGPGPIEISMSQGIEPQQMIEYCRSSRLQALICPMYLRYIAYKANDLTRTQDWQIGIWLSRFATEAAIAWDPEGGVGHDIREVVLSHIGATTFATLHALDDTVFSQTIQLAMVIIARAEQHGDVETLGKLFHNLGALFSDIWTVPGPPDDPSPVDIWQWLARPKREPGLFAGLDESHAIPVPEECLHSAISWYRRALPYRHGLERGLTYKALLQTMHFSHLVFKTPIEQKLFMECASLAPELLKKHPLGEQHVRSVESIAKEHGLSTIPPQKMLSFRDNEFLASIRKAYDPGSPDTVEPTRRKEGHERAILDIERALRHSLPFAVYLRNFDTASQIHTIAEPIVHKTEHQAHIVVPQITYSLVDHKLLQLFDEGVVAVSDPHSNWTHRKTLIPMLSLQTSVWLPIVRGLVERSARVVMLLDELTEGVQSEIALLRSAEIEKATLIVTGHSFRSQQRELPPEVSTNFPYIVDWIDFGYDENYYSMQYKAHRIIQDHLRTFVQKDAKPIIKAWLGRADTPSGLILEAN